MCRYCDMEIEARKAEIKSWIAERLEENRKRQRELAADPRAVEEETSPSGPPLSSAAATDPTRLATEGRALPYMGRRRLDQGDDLAG
jgi:hypothetical protein